MKFINVPVFIISLALGLLMVYLSTPGPDIIYVYPTPENINKIQYKDETGTCFGFTQQEVSCPTNETLMRKYPMQEKKQKML